MQLLRVNIIKDPIEMNIYGQKIKALPPLKAMVQLILHHYKEMNSLYHLTRHNCITRSMFQDVYYLWKNNQRNISFERLTEIITKYDTAPVLRKRSLVIHLSWEMLWAVSINSD